VHVIFDIQANKNVALSQCMKAWAETERIE
jgi:hypothetical protein